MRKGGCLRMTVMGIQWLSHQENVRSNKMKEGLTFQTLSETIRTNKVNEGIRQGTLDESVRSNKAKESISWSNLAENTRHNVVSENLGFSTLSETQRANQARESENTRSNKASEANYRYSTDLNVLKSAAPGFAIWSTDVYNKSTGDTRTGLDVLASMTTGGDALNNLIPNLFN